jgi:Mg2+ and Co2+ transporter CorA
MYGMNVPLPYQTEPWAYPAMMGVIVVVVFLIYLIAKRLRIF